MKAFIAALALVTLFSVPTVAQHAEREAPPTCPRRAPISGYGNYCRRPSISQRCEGFPIGTLPDLLYLQRSGLGGCARVTQSNSFCRVV